MNPKELKHAFAEDVKIIKGLEPEIIPARIYYGELLKIAAIGFCILWAIISITIAYAGINHPTHEALAEEPMYQIMHDAILMGFFMSLPAILVLTPAINFFVLFRFHFEDKLKMGALVSSKLKHIAYLFLVIFMLFSAMFASYGESAVIFMMLGFAFFGSLATTCFLVRIELNRIGLNAIFTIMNEFFNKGRETKALE